MTAPREMPRPCGPAESSSTNGGSRGDSVSLGGNLWDQYCRKAEEELGFRCDCCRSDCTACRAIGDRADQLMDESEE